MEQPRYIDRPPRIQPELPLGDVGIPGPPQEERVRNRSLIQLFLPMVTILGYLMISVFGRGRSLLFMIPMGISVLASVGVALYTRFKDQENEGRSQAAYAERLVELRKEMNVKHDMQRRFYRYNYPNPNMVQQIAADAYRFSGKPGGGESDLSKRIWERRSSDSDFGMLRLGIGVRPSSVGYALEEKGGAGTFDNPLYRDALRLEEDARFVDNTPITIPLREGNLPNSAHDSGKSAARHAIGITGSHSYAIYAFVQALLTHFAVFHSPNNARIQIVGVEAARNQWRWASNLPHCMTSKDSSLVFESDKDRAGDRDRNQLNQYLKGIRKLYDDRKMRAADDSNSQEIRLPLNLLVVDLLPDIPESSVLSEVESDPAISIVLNEGQSIGGAVLVLVPHQEKIPSNCQAMIEVVVSEVDQELNKTGGRKKISFRYVETGVNTPRYIGEADQESDLEKLTRFAQHLTPLMVRQSYGSDLPRGVMMMDMLKVQTIEELRAVTRQKWAHSVTPDLADWLKVTLGAMSGGDLRTLQFAAHADGVHGLIAGSTGSGKSELLMTMIIGLALNYDPTIVNFVLVDFKGGAAFEPFRHLPHCVDIVTNLAGAGVERMFAAITAELNRRQAINVETDSKHIVHYRKRSLHETPYGSTVEIKSNRYQTAPYPHLFVFIDEFAEMISDNPAYKAQLDTITRLGRALGVTLILAAQRPTGVTDQMRANIKFRISLRVETREESSEVLRRPDAAYLPTDIPGRGYLQVGNENIELIQVAWTGADYRGGRKKEKPKIIWHDRPRDQEDEPGEDELPKVYEVMVDMMNDLSQEVSLAQRKPWPNFLPSAIDLLSDIDGSYVNENELLWFNPDPAILKAKAETDEATDLSFHIPANRTVGKWLDGEASWPKVDWSRRAMRPVVGIVDNPYQAEMLPLMIDFRRGHAVIFGASGWGKTTFLRTLIASLAVDMNPESLHIYIMDFGGRQLYLFQDRLPHLGAIISPDEEDRVQRLLRKLDDMLDARKKQITAAGANDLYDYNQRFPHLPLPAVLVVIDNYAEFRENFEALGPMLLSIVRESRAYGIHFVVTATLPNILGGKIYNLFSERMTLKLSEPSEYVGIVGRGAQPIGDIAGRGLININRRPLSFQVALPVPPINKEELLDDGTNLINLLDLMKDAAQSLPETAFPDGIQTLPSQVLLGKLLIEAGELSQPKVSMAVGIDDFDLSPYQIQMASQGPHAFIIGPPNSGKTTLLRTMILSLCSAYRPGEVEIALIDLQQRLFRYGGEEELSSLPQVALAIADEEELEHFADTLITATERLGKPGGPKAIFVIIDNYSAFDETSRDYKQMMPALGRLARRRGTDGLHFIACGGTDITRGSDELRRQLKAPGFGIALRSADAAQNLNGRVPRSLQNSEFPLGRGFVVKSGRTRMVQFATPYAPGEQETLRLDSWVNRLYDQYGGDGPKWVLAPREAVEEEKAAKPSRSRSTAKPRSRKRAETKLEKPKPKGTAVPDGVDLETVKRELQIMGGWSDAMINSLSSSDIIDTARALGVLPAE